MTQMQKLGKIVDVHAHIIMEHVKGIKHGEFIPHVFRNSTGREFMAIKGRTLYPLSKQYGHMYDPDKRIRDMDELGVNMQALSCVSLLSILDEVDHERAVSISRAQNDWIAKVVETYPHRFVGLATVPLQEPSAAAEELERAMNQLAMRGAEIGSSVKGRNLDARELWPFYEKAEELNAFIFVHPTNVQGVERMQNYHLSNLIGNPSATSLAVASLIFGGVLEEFPKLKFCFAHAGGFSPYQRGRLEHGYQVRTECQEKISKPPSEYFKLLYFDTITHYEPALIYLIKSVGSDHVLLGSDYPFDMADFNPVSSVSSLKTISINEKRRILGENAAKLLKLPLQEH